ncbi:MAG: DUF3256 family protein [Prevotella sp.]|nr:DUF3256 family protein [Prevotella sp.]
MRKWLLCSLWVLIVGASPAQELALRDVFRQMPDSLMPSLSLNNRLDFIDFLDSNMKASVRNQLGGLSEMTALIDDSLSVKMSEALRVDMLLLTLDEPVDTTLQVVVFAETYLTDSLYGETSLRFYTPDWQLITKNIPWNEIQKKRIDNLILQNILKWSDDKLNKS